MATSLNIQLLQLFKKMYLYLIIPYINRHDGLILSSSNCSAVASLSLLDSFSFASNGNQSCIKLSIPQSTLSSNKRKIVFEINIPGRHHKYHLLLFAVRTEGALHNGQSSLLRFCILTRQRTQKTWPQVNLIGLKAMFVQIKQE